MDEARRLFKASPLPLARRGPAHTRMTQGVAGVVVAAAVPPASVSSIHTGLVTLTGLVEAAAAVAAKEAATVRESPNTTGAAVTDDVEPLSPIHPGRRYDCAQCTLL